MIDRTEHWARDGVTAEVYVTDERTVAVAYELFAQMMTELGYCREQE